MTVALGTAGPLTLPDDGYFRLPVRVYYEDTDVAGIVYYANYLRFAERARTEVLRALGIEQSRLREENDVIFAVTDARIRYLQPAHLDDLLEIRTRILQVGAASVTMEQLVVRDEAQLAQLEVRVACLHHLGGRPARLPQKIRNALQSLLSSREPV